MNNKLLSLLSKTFVDAHYLIALAAVGTFWQTYYLCIDNIKPTSTLLVLSGLIFAMTLGIYNLHSLIGIQYLKKIPSNYFNRFKLIESYPQIFYLNFIFSVIIAIFFMFKAKEITLLQLIIPFILGLLYIIPIFGQIRLRDFPFVKVFLVAFVWAWVTVYLPFAHNFMDYKNLSPFFIERLLFIFAITLVFDIRDIELDQLEGIKTINNVLGSNFTINLSTLLLIFWSLLSFFIYANNYILLITGLIIAYLVYRLKNIAIKDTYFSIVLDGSILVLSLLSIFFILSTQ